MEALYTVNDILSQVKKLDKEDQYNLLQKLAVLLKKKDANVCALSLISLSGLGSEIWKSKNDIDNYIDEQRQW